VGAVYPWWCSRWWVTARLEELDSCAENVLRPVGDEVRVQAWDIAAAASFLLMIGSIDFGTCALIYAPKKQGDCRLSVGQLCPLPEKHAFRWA
jgi:hypothetical protein